MSKFIEVKVPDIGDYKEIPVIEIHVRVGDLVEKESNFLIQVLLIARFTIVANSNEKVYLVCVIYIVGQYRYCCGRPVLLHNWLDISDFV